MVGFLVIDPSGCVIRAFLMTALTLATVGYGEDAPVDSDPARVFTAVLILVGMGAVLYFVSTGTVFILEGRLRHVFRRRRMQRDLSEISGHHIVCDLNLRIEGVPIPEGSSVVGKPISEIGLEKLPQILLLPVREGDHWEYNPDRTCTLNPGAEPIFLGSPEGSITLREGFAK